MAGNSKEITQKLYSDALCRQVVKRKSLERQTSPRNESGRPSMKASQKSNEIYAGRLLKQIEKAFTDLSCFEMQDLSIETVEDILAYLGYSGE